MSETTKSCARARGTVARNGPKTPARGATRHARFTLLLLVYRMPATPTAGRVAVWRLLQKIGTIYIQQSCCVFPNTEELKQASAPVLARISDARAVSLVTSWLSVRLLRWMLPQGAAVAARSV